MGKIVISSESILLESITLMDITHLDMMTIGIVSVTSIEMVHGVLVGVHGCYQWLGSLEEEQESE